MKCEICEKEIASFKGLGIHIITKHNMSSKEYYDKYYLKENENLCKTCKKETKFKSLTQGYQKFCNLKCSNNNENVKNKISKSNKERWSNIDYNSLNALKSKISISVKKQWKDINSNYNKPEYHNKIKKARQNFQNLKHEKYINNINNSSFLLAGNYVNAITPTLFKCKKCNYIFETIWNYIQQGKKCPICEKPISTPEVQLKEFIKSLNFGIIENSKKIIPPKELDIYIPSLNIAIEFNGLFWHSEQNIKDPNYHLYKTKECNKLGIQLIHIFEDEWLFKEEIVKNRLKQILKVKGDKQIVYARNCTIKEINSTLKNNFLESFHIQGKDTSIIKLGSFYNDQLVGVMTFSYGNISKGSKKEDLVWELNRFCVNYNYHIPGIASKLLSYFKRNFEWNKIFSYADARWSNGNMYYKLGFDYIKNTKPNYWYLQNYKRIHRFNFRKREDEPKDIPEWLLRQKEGFYRIWDCGNLKFELNKK